MSKQSQDVKQIHYFHCTPDRSDYLLLYPNMLRILASAYRIKKFPRIKRHLSLARELFIDSGMISAHKKGEYEWQYQQAFVIEVADEVSADYVAMLDIPCEPKMLKRSGMTVDQALYRTIENAKRFLELKPLTAKKVFVIQGFALDEYRKCIDAYRDLGILDLNDVWLAIGSVCMRSPKNGLYSIARLVRHLIPDCHLHCFGIGKKAWIQALGAIGIDSFDSAKASISVAFNRGVCRVEGKRTDAQVVRQFADEMLAVEQYLNTPEPQLNALKLLSGI